MDDLKQAITTGRLFDYVASNYHLISKGELVTLVKELDYELSSAVPNKKYKEIMNTIADALGE